MICLEKMKILDITLRLVSIVLLGCCSITDGICIDTATAGYCNPTRCSEPQARAVCLRTCGACTDRSQVGPPAFAQAPNIVNPPILNNNNNNNGYSNNAGNQNSGNSLAAPDLPMWAVILIVVFLVALFTSCVCIYFHCKRKFKERRIEKNRWLLQLSKPSNNEANAQTNGPTWDDNNDWDPDYDEERTDKNDGRIPSDKSRWEPNNLNNSLRPETRYTLRNINMIHNDVETIKRKAPPPPSSEIYENLSPEGASKTQTKSRAPARPPPIDDTSVKSTTGPLVDEESDDPHKNETTPQPVIPPRTLPRTKTMPSTPPSPPTLPPPRDDESSILSDSESSRNESDTELRTRRLSDDTVTYSDMSVYESTTMGGTSVNQLSEILHEWKDHLAEQKNELQQYYNRLIDASGNKPLEPMDSASNIGRNDVRTLSHTGSGSFHPTLNRSLSMGRQERIATVLSEAPESMFEDWQYDPTDIKNQRKVISQLKLKLSDLENLLYNTRELTGTMDETTIISDSAYAPAVPKPTEQQTFTMPPQSYHGAPRNQRQNTYSAPPPRKPTRLTIDFLIMKLDKQERERCLNMISDALLASRGHVGMAMREKHVDQSVATRLTRQIHHVMRDVIHPQQRTSITLATHAASNLMAKLTKSVQAEKLALHSINQESSNLCLQMAEAVEQMLEMSNHLEKRKNTYTKQDIFTFIQMFIKVARKCMSHAYTFVSTYGHAPSDVQSMRSTIDSTRQRIRQNLNTGKIATLNDELVKLEQLLKSGAITSISTSQPKDRDNDAFESSFDSDSETESIISCSTCAPNDDVERKGRNPYIFPGNRSVPNTKAHTLQPKPMGQQSDPAMLTIANNRPPTRPQRTAGNPHTKQGTLPSLSQNRQNEHPQQSNDLTKLNNFHNENKIVPQSHDPAQQLMYAKYLNEMLRSQPANKNQLYLPKKNDNPYNGRLPTTHKQDPTPLRYDEQTDMRSRDINLKDPTLEPHENRLDQNIKQSGDIPNRKTKKSKKRKRHTVAEPKLKSSDHSRQHHIPTEQKIPSENMDLYEEGKPVEYPEKSVETVPSFLNEPSAAKEGRLDDEFNKTNKSGTTSKNEVANATIKKDSSTTEPRGVDLECSGSDDNSKEKTQLIHSDSSHRDKVVDKNVETEEGVENSEHEGYTQRDNKSSSKENFEYNAYDLTTQKNEDQGVKEQSFQNKEDEPESVETDHETPDSYSNNTVVTDQHPNISQDLSSNLSNILPQAASDTSDKSISLEVNNDTDGLTDETNGPNFDGNLVVGESLNRQ